jgi:hypothetical protein
MYLCSLVCSANSTLTSFYVSSNPMSAVACKAIELEFVLCRMRNPTVTDIDASGKGFDDQDAIRIGEGLRFVLYAIPICLLSRNILFTKRHVFDVATRFFLVDKGHYQGVSVCNLQPKRHVKWIAPLQQPNWRCWCCLDWRCLGVRRSFTT